MILQSLTLNTNVVFTGYEEPVEPNEAQIRDIRHAFAFASLRVRLMNLSLELGSAVSHHISRTPHDDYSISVSAHALSCTNGEYAENKESLNICKVCSV